jgi:hypothetical protein
MLTPSQIQYRKNNIVKTVEYAIIRPDGSVEDHLKKDYAYKTARPGDLIQRAVITRKGRAFLSSDITGERV